MSYHRRAFDAFAARLREPPGLIQILAGPRQVGKTTLIRQLIDAQARPPSSSRYVPADSFAQAIGAPSQPTGLVARATARPVDTERLVEQWTGAVLEARAWAERERTAASSFPFVLVIDEIQKVPQWSATIKGLWDEMQASGSPMHVVLLGSSPLLMQKGLTESLAGRFEVTRMTHWSFEEMNEAFDLSLDQYIYFGGFPGSAAYITDETRWRDYVNLSLIRPAIDQDILMMTRVDKPALLRNLFELGCLYSGQVVALDKLLGQLQDAGNVTTLARYLDLLADADLLCGLQKHSDGAVRRRKAPPKLQALNNALVTAQGSHSFDQACADRSHWGHLVESAVGAHLINAAESDTAVRYWRDGAHEVDFVIERRGKIAAIEVKSNPQSARHRGLEEFVRRHPGCRAWQVGGDRLPIGEVLRRPVSFWVE